MNKVGTPEPDQPKIEAEELSASDGLPPRQSNRPASALHLPPAEMALPLWSKKRLHQLLLALVALLEIPGPDSREWLRRVTRIERNVVLPIKGALIGMLLYSFYSSPWVGRAQSDLEISVEWTQQFLWVYIAVNLAVGACLVAVRKLPLGLVQWVVFAACLVDGIFLSTLLVLTGGYESFLYWIFVALIVRSAASIPRATSQLVLNFTLIACYVMAGVTHISIASNLDEKNELERRMLMMDRPQKQRSLRAAHLATNAAPVQGMQTPRLQATNEAVTGKQEDAHQPPAGRELLSDSPAEPLLVRLVLLLLITVCSYGVQVLLQRQREAIEEAREFAVREVQLHAAGRLAAQFAHQIKNPLAIINNAAYSLHRGLGSRPEAAMQIQMIQEEVEHADRIITQVMGYAQLSEGHVEKLNVLEQLDYAIERVFPPAAGFPIEVRRQYSGNFPPLVMLRSHASETFINVLQNAREAIGDKGGIVSVSARCKDDYSIEVAISDTGPGIPPDKIARIFEAYYTTKEKGTGLGLATVRHNVELYGGRVLVESELGKGARFTLVFPAKTLMKLAATT